MVKINENNKKQGVFFNFKFNKNNVIGENKTSILLKFDATKDYESFIFWVNKNYVKFSNFTNFIEISLYSTFEYNIYPNNKNIDWNKPSLKQNGQDLYNSLKQNNYIE